MPRDQLDTRRYRESLRLTFRFDGPVVGLVRLDRIRKVAPGTFGESPVGGVHSGAWLELRDEAGEVLFHRLLHDPLRTRAEHHSPDGPIELHFREPEQGVFEALVPAIPEARTAVVWSSPWEPDRTTEPAVELARVALFGPEDRGDVRGRH